MSETKTSEEKQRRKEIMAIVTRLARYWLENPELRLGQLVSNLAPVNHSVFYISDVVIDNELRKQLEVKCHPR